LWSSQFNADPPTHALFAHTSPVVQAFPSSQAATLFAWAQPVRGAQESFVHMLLSLQFSAAPPVHAPFAHVSPVVHALPSLQALVLLVKTQPIAPEHESDVQALLSLQVTGAPGRQNPNTQASLTVQAFPSLQTLLLLV